MCAPSYLVWARLTTCVHLHRLGQGFSTFSDWWTTW